MHFLINKKGTPGRHHHLFLVWSKLRKSEGFHSQPVGEQRWLSRWWIISISLARSPSRGAAEIFKVPPLFPLWSRWGMSISAKLHSPHFSTSNNLWALSTRTFQNYPPPHTHTLYYYYFSVFPNPRGGSPGTTHRSTNLDWFDRSWYLLLL